MAISSRSIGTKTKYTTGTVAVDATGLIVTITTGTFDTDWGEGDAIAIKGTTGAFKNTGFSSGFKTFNAVGFVRYRKSSTQLILQTALSGLVNQSSLSFSIARAYSGLTGWGAACPADLVTSTTIWKGCCYKDSDFNETLKLSAATSNANYYQWLTAPDGQRHTGRAGTGAKIKFTGTVYASGLPILIDATSANFSIIEYLDIDCAGLGGAPNSAPYGLSAIVSGYDCTIRNNIIHDAVGNDGGTRDMSGIGCDLYYGNCYVYNNIVYEFNRQGYTGNGISGAYRTYARIENNTVYRCPHGISAGFNQTNTGGVLATNKNNISMDNALGDFAYDASPTVTSLNCMSSDVTADDAGGTGHLISKSSTNQFISKTAGSEDLRILATADAVGAGLTLTRFQNDIQNNIRTGTWDMGANEYILIWGRTIGTLPTTVRTGTIDAMSAGATAVVGTGTLFTTEYVVGDRIIIYAEHYVISSITDATHLTLSSGVVADVAAGTPHMIMGRDYSNIVAWEAACPADLTTIQHAWVGYCYKDTTFTDAPTIAGTTTSSTYYIQLTAPSSQRHNGKQGTGVVLDPSTADNGITASDSNVIIEYLEITGWGINSGQQSGIVSTGVANIIRYNLIHDGFLAVAGNGITFGAGATNVNNTLIYRNIIYDSTIGASMSCGIRYTGFNALTGCVIANNTFHLLSSGVFQQAGNFGTLQNNIFSSCTTDINSWTFSVCSYNATTAAALQGTNNVLNLVAANTYISATSTCDLRLKPGAAVIGVGTNLGSPYNTDVTGQALYSSTWDIGAHQYMISSGIGTSSRDYSTITAWQAGCPTDLTLTGGDHVWQGLCYKDSVFNEAAVITGITTDSTHYVWLTAPVGQRHTGTAGTGVVISRSGVLGASTSHIRITNSFTIIEWLECTYGAVTSGSYNTHIAVTNGNGSIIRNCIVHETTSSMYQPASGINVSTSYSSNYVLNNFIYNIYAQSTGAISAIQDAQSVQGFAIIENNTVYNVTGAASNGIIQNGVGTVKNNIVLSVGNLCFNVGNGTYGNNISSDATAPGSGSLTGKTAVNNLVNTTPGSEDLHLKLISSAIRSGVYIGILAGVNIDIDGFDRNRIPGAWNIGADDFISGGDNPVVPAVTCGGAGVVGVAATGSAVIASITCSGAGTVSVAATGSDTIPAVTASGSGASTHTASASATIPTATASGTGVVGVSATATATIPAVTAAGSGSHGVVSSSSASIPATTCSGTGVVGVSGSGSVHLGTFLGSPYSDAYSDGFQGNTYFMITATGSGISARSGSGSVTVPAVTASGTGIVGVACSGSVIISTVKCSGVGAVSVACTGSAIIPAATCSGVGSVSVACTGSATIPAVTASGSGVVGVSCTGTDTVPAITCSGSGTVSVSATGSAIIPAVTASGTGVVSVTTSASLVIPSTTCSGTGLWVSSGALGSGTIPAVTASGTGTVSVVCSGSVVIPAATCSGTGTHTAPASGSITIPTIICHGIGLVSVSATGSATIPSVSASGSGSHGVSGSGSATVAAALCSGSGSVSVACSGQPEISATICSGTGVVGTEATGSVEIAPISCFGTGSVSVSASGSAVIPTATCSGIGIVGVVGFGYPSISSTTCSGVGFNFKGAAADLTIPTVAASGSGSVGVSGSGDVAIATITTTSIANRGVVGSGDITLPQDVIFSQGGDVHQGTGIETLPQIILIGEGIASRSGTGNIQLPLITASGIGNAYMSWLGQGKQIHLDGVLSFEYGIDAILVGDYDLDGLLQGDYQIEGQLELSGM